MCQQFRITGRVQGVFFRASTRDVALSLGIRGYAINLPDGSVEVRACGTPQSIEDLRRWLAKGPPMSKVDDVEETVLECSAPADFVTG